jgi:hypothetical protein
MTKAAEHIELGIGDARVPLGDHLAFLWETEEEFGNGVGFLERGLKADDYGVIFGHDDANEKVLAVLRDRGLDVDALLTAGRLILMQGTEDAGAMLAGIGSQFADAVGKGARVIRLLGNLGWGRAGWPNQRDILAFEAKVTEAARLFPCVVVCMYDVTTLSGPILVHGGYETHPRTIQRGIVRENPYHVTTDEFLGSLRIAEGVDE